MQSIQPDTSRGFYSISFLQSRKKIWFWFWFWFPFLFFVLMSCLSVMLRAMAASASLFGQYTHIRKFNSIPGLLSLYRVASIFPHSKETVWTQRLAARDDCCRMMHYMHILTYFTYIYMPVSLRGHMRVQLSNYKFQDDLDSPTSTAARNLAFV